MRFATIAALALMFMVHAPTIAADGEEQRVDQIFAPYHKTDSPGCVLGAIRDGSFVYRKAHGTANLELGVPLSPESVFDMGSISKQFTAAAVVMAAEQGYLSLDDSIRKYIPELPDYGEPITLRHMLHHISGFRDQSSLLVISGRNLDVHSTDELIDLVARQKALNFNPGSEWSYSNTNYFLLAEVVKRATKKSLAQFAAEHIFQPLGMAHTRFHDDHTVVVPGRVSAYGPGTDGHFVVNWSTNPDWVGDRGLMSNVDDLLLWDRNFYENRLGKGTLLKEMLASATLKSGKRVNYALGLILGMYRGLPTVHHEGDVLGYHTSVLRFPEQRFTIVCLCNVSAGALSLSYRVADVFLEKDLRSSSVASQPANAPAGLDALSLVGDYVDIRDHSLWSFTATGANLSLRASLGRAALTPAGGNRFVGPGGLIATFVSSDNAMKATIDRDDQTLFTGARIEQVHPSESALAAYVGSYKSEELDAIYRLSVDNGSLTLRVNWNPPVKLTPTVLDEFDGEHMILVFRRNAQRRVSGIRVFARGDRVRDLTFEKVS